MKIVGISGCPTGVAHTYMAAEALTEEGKARGFEIKIETQGVDVENKLIKQDIEQADFVIIAAGKTIDKSRFIGKILLEVKISDALKDASGTLDKLLACTEVYQHSDQSEGGNDLFDTTNVTGVYKHLMTGVSFMLPFVVAGGIIIALSFAFGINASNPDDPSYNVIAGMLDTIGGGSAFALMLPVLAGGIAYSISKRNGIAPGAVAGMMAVSGGSGFLGAMLGGFFAGYVTNFINDHIKVGKDYQSIKIVLIVPLLSVLITGFAMATIIGIPVAFILTKLTDFLNSLSGANAILIGALFGGMMALDMGGPFNKTVSVFSIGLMSSGINEPIAACMAAGMTPPLGIALSTVIAKRKYSNAERQAAKVNWILGASYITEGAIPFAVTDPFRVIPSLVVGSAVTGAMSMFFGVASLAPHGGIWVMLIPNVITNLPMYILSIVVGTVVTAVMLSVLKKDFEEKNVN